MAKKIVNYSKVQEYDHTKRAKTLKDFPGHDVVKTVPGQTISVKELVARQENGRPNQ